MPAKEHSFKPVGILAKSEAIKRSGNKSLIKFANREYKSFIQLANRGFFGVDEPSLPPSLSQIFPFSSDLPSVDGLSKNPGTLHRR